MNSYLKTILNRRYFVSNKATIEEMLANTNIHGELALVYQSRFASLFDVVRWDKPRQCFRVHAPLDFASCELIAIGAALAGVKVSSWCCNVVGDAQNEVWCGDLLRLISENIATPIWWPTKVSIYQKMDSTPFKRTHRLSANPAPRTAKEFSS
jgi:hypothetical protein